MRNPLLSVLTTPRLDRARAVGRAFVGATLFVCSHALAQAAPVPAPAAPPAASVAPAPAATAPAKPAPAKPGPAVEWEEAPATTAAPLPPPPPATPKTGLTQGMLDPIRDVFSAGDDVPMRTPLGAPIFAEERTPPADPDNPDALRFKIHGYFRAPFLMSWTRRQGSTPGEAKFELRSPYLIDNDYVNSGFAYTPVNETAYGEVFLMMGNRSLTATLALMTGEYSDSSEININNQMGISQGYITYRYEPNLVKGLNTHLQIKGGSFWDRYGYMEHYDTYIFGRTHQVGYQARLDADTGGDFKYSLLQGLGAHLENQQANQAFSLLNSLRAAATYKNVAEVGFYYLRSWSQDKPALTQLQDASMLVAGVDARINTPKFGRLYVAGSSLSAKESLFLSPTIEMMNSLGGTGLTDNYFGTTSSQNGTGGMMNFGFQYDYSVATLLRTMDPASRPLWGGDMTLSVYGLYSYVTSQQNGSSGMGSSGSTSGTVMTDPSLDKNDRKYFKWGAEYQYWALSWAGLALRYDAVIQNVDDNASSFRIFSPRFNLRAKWMGESLIYVQYSHYFYGERVTLRPGQVVGLGTNTVPDENVIKLQAQMNF